MHVVVSDDVEALGYFFIDTTYDPPQMIARGFEHCGSYESFPFASLSREIAGRAARRNPWHIHLVGQGRARTVVTIERLRPDGFGGWMWRLNDASYVAADLATAISEVFIAFARAAQSAPLAAATDSEVAA